MEQVLITLLLKIGVAASIASVGVRSEAVTRMLLREERTLAQRVRMALWFAAIFMPGVSSAARLRTDKSVAQERAGLYIS